MCLYLTRSVSTLLLAYIGINVKKKLSKNFFLTVTSYWVFIKWDDAKRAGYVLTCFVVHPSEPRLYCCCLFNEIIWKQMVRQWRCHMVNVYVAVIFIWKNGRRDWSQKINWSTVILQANQKGLCCQPCHPDRKCPAFPLVKEDVIPVTASLLILLGLVVHRNDGPLKEKKEAFFFSI